MNKTITVSPEQHATIMAALRFWQERDMCEPSNRSDWLQDIATGGHNLTSLNAEGVDELCEEINGGEQPLNLTTGFTIWVQDQSREGTCHVNFYLFETQAMAELEAIATVSADWEVSPDSLEIVGVAQGNVRILKWED